MNNRSGANIAPYKFVRPPCGCYWLGNYTVPVWGKPPEKVSQVNISLLSTKHFVSVNRQTDRHICIVLVYVMDNNKMHSAQPCFKRRAQRLVINISQHFGYGMCFHLQLKDIFNTCQTLQSLKTEAQDSTLRYFSTSWPSQNITLLWFLTGCCSMQIRSSIRRQNMNRTVQFYIPTFGWWRLSWRYNWYKNLHLK